MSIPFSLKLLTSGGKSDLRIINLEFPGGSMYYGSGIMAVVGVATVGAGSIPSPGTFTCRGCSENNNNNNNNNTGNQREGKKNIFLYWLLHQPLTLFPQISTWLFPLLPLLCSSVIFNRAINLFYLKL